MAEMAPVIDYEPDMLPSVRVVKPSAMSVEETAFELERGPLVGRLKAKVAIMKTLNKMLADEVMNKYVDLDQVKHIRSELVHAAAALWIYEEGRSEQEKDAEIIVISKHEENNDAPVQSQVSDLELSNDTQPDATLQKLPTVENVLTEQAVAPVVKKSPASKPKVIQKRDHKTEFQETDNNIMEPRDDDESSEESAIVGKDSMGMYVDDLYKKGKNLLTAEQEVELAKRIEAGLVAEKVMQARQAEDLESHLHTQMMRDIESLKAKDQKSATPQAEDQIAATIDLIEKMALDSSLSDEELEWLANDGINAKSEFLEKNLRLAVSIARRYYRSGTPSMQMIDMISEGNFGIMRAVEKFDYTKGYKFSTYATWWVRQSITRALADKSKTIRIPVHMNESVVAYRREMGRFLSVNDRNPTDTELCHVLKMKPEELANVREAIRREPISTNALLDENGDTEFGDLIGEQETGFQNIEQSLAYVALRRELDTLSEREKFIIEHRFGLDTGEPKTLDQIGELLGVTRERVRQIEAKTMSKLRHPSRSGRLGNILDNF